MLDNVGLIHMNGRVYDPALGRFLSVDPVFQFPTNTQSLNPYSYVRNSPLSATDPSGFLEGEDGAVIPQSKGAEVAADSAPENGGSGEGTGVSMSDAPDSNDSSTTVVSHQREKTSQMSIAGGSSVSMPRGDVTKSEFLAGEQENGTPIDPSEVGGLAKRMYGKGGDLEITDEERHLVEQGDLKRFYQSRTDEGDPYGRRGLSYWDPDNPVLTEDDKKLAAKSLVWLAGHVVVSYAGGRDAALKYLRNPLDTNARDNFLSAIRPIGLALAQEFIAEVDSDVLGRIGTRGLLSVEQGVNYHHRAFVNMGLSTTAFGATPNPFMEDQLEANLTDLITGWCSGCDPIYR